MKTQIILLFLLTIPASSAYDIALTPAFDELPDDGEIAHLLRIENLDYEQGHHYAIRVNLSYNITSRNMSLNGSSTHTINKYTTNTIGATIGNNSWISFCGRINSNSGDENPNNDEGCWNISRIVETPVNESIEINETEEQNASNENHSEEALPIINCSQLLITEAPTITKDGEQFQYRFEPWESGDEVSYWIEDLFGSIIKTEVTTSRNSVRRYTPHRNAAVDVLILKAIRAREECNDSYAESFVIVKGEEEPDDESEEDIKDGIELIDVPDEVKAGEPFDLKLIISKSDNRRRVISISIGDTTSKLRLSTKGEYELSIPISTAMNCDEEEELELLVEGLGEEISIPLTITTNECPEKTITTPLKSTISNLYVRAQNYQEEINLYGNSDAEEDVMILYGGAITRVDGSFSLPINPRPGNNTVVVGSLRGEQFIGRMTQFELIDKNKANEAVAEEHQKTIEENEADEETNSITGHYTLPTGETQDIISEQKDYTLSILGALLILGGAAGGLKWLKGKHLRRTEHPSE